MRMKMKRFLGILLSLALVLSLMSGMSLTAHAAETGTIDGFSYTLDDEGTLTLTGSGTLTRANAGSFGGNDNIKKVVFAKGCGDVTIGQSVFSGSNNITNVEINSTNKVSVGHNAFFKYSGNGAYTVTITAPEIELLGEWPFFNYWEEQAFTLNGKVTAAKGIMTSAEDNVTVTINGEAIIYQPAGKVFSGPGADGYQEQYDRYLSFGETSGLQYVIDEAIQAGCTVTDSDASETTMTAENASQVFGKADVTINVPTFAVTYKVVNGTWTDGTKADLTENVTSGAKPSKIPTGMKASEGYTGGAWDVDPAEKDITEAATFTYTFTEKQAATVTKDPTAKSLTYNGKAQELVEAGTAEGGKLYYAVTTKNVAPTDDNLYTTSIPTETDAGTYYVWYKVVGDENHTDTEPVMLKVTIDVAQGETEIKTEVQTDEKSPKLEASNLTKEVAESTLDDKEKKIIDEAVNDGKDVDVDVYLAIRDIADEITAEDKAKLEAEASNAGQLAYFDISLYKEIKVDGSSLGATAISELQKPLKLTIGVPKSFPAVETGYTRTYTVLRLHKGEVTTLPTTVNVDGTISFETDRFSVYALVYKDTKEATTTEATTVATTEAASTSDATTASTTTEAAKTSPKTGDSMPIAVLAVLMFAAAGMLVFMDLKKKKN